MQITSLDKYNNKKNIIDSTSKIRLRHIAYPLLMKLSKSKVKYKIIKENEYYPISNKPIIFSCNHQQFQDTPIACDAIGRHAYILAGKQNLYFEDDIFFNINGSIFLDRKNKKDMVMAKTAMIQYLKKGENILMFPEGTWNLSDNLLVMPMKWGIFDVAKEADAQVIPMILDYQKNTMECHVTFGNSIIAKKIDLNSDLIKQLRNEMATIIWNNIEKRELIHRNEVNSFEERKKMESVLIEYPILDYEYEKSIIYKPDISPEEVFEPIKRLKY